jgi:hypothetical protein
MDIYITKDGNRLGPFSIEEARRQRANGTILNSDLAWHQGLPAWVPLSEIAGFNPLTTAMPPIPSALRPPVHGTTGQAPTGLRIVTAMVLFVISFVVLFVVVSMISLMVGGAIAGSMAGATQHADGFQQGYAIGHEAGKEFGQKYGVLIFAGSALFSFLASILLSISVAFSNFLPWCRRR